MVRTVAVTCLDLERRRLLAKAFAITTPLVLALALLATVARAEDAASDSAAASNSSTTNEAEFFPVVPTASPELASANPNARPPVVRMVRLAHRDRNVVRSGPGEHFSIAGVFPKGETFEVIAKSGDWYNVRLSSTETGWVHSSLCKEFDDLSGLEFKPNPRLYTRTGSYVLSGVAGAYAFDRKSNSLLLGGRLGYYVFDRFQVDAGVAWTHVRRPAEIVETLFGLSLEAEDFHMLFYDLNVVMEVLPGRQMVPYVVGGVGSSIMLGRTEASWNFGAGTALFVSKRTAVRWEVRDYRFQSGSEEARLNNDNIAFTLSTVMLF